MLLWSCFWSVSSALLIFWILDFDATPSVPSGHFHTLAPPSPGSSALPSSPLMELSALPWAPALPKQRRERCLASKMAMWLYSVRNHLSVRLIGGKRFSLLWSTKTGAMEEGFVVRCVQICPVPEWRAHQCKETGMWNDAPVMSCARHTSLGGCCDGMWGWGGQTSTWVYWMTRLYHDWILFFPGGTDIVKVLSLPQTAWSTAERHKRPLNYSCSLI